MTPRLIIIGGFLGAGKTTTIAHTARQLLKRGAKVAVVTNDQGSDLVDTAFLQSHDLLVREVPDGCFCCNYDEFVQRAADLAQRQVDIILAEPVGSCTDLVATVMKPLLREQTPFVIAPFTVVCDPRRIRRLMNDTSPFPTEINMLCRKQLEEADLLLLNKCDTQTDEEIEELREFLNTIAPGARVFAISAQTDQGMEAWLEAALGQTFVSKPSLELDYAGYAAAEAALGWINVRFRLTADADIDMECIVERGLGLLGETIRKKGGEIAHLKAQLVGGSGGRKISQVSNESELEWSNDKLEPCRSAVLLVNARMVADPSEMCMELEHALEKACEGKVFLEKLSEEAFRPSEPHPVHRI